MQHWKSNIRRWIARLRISTLWKRSPARSEHAQHQDDVARWVDEGGAGNDPLRRTA